MSQTHVKSEASTMSPVMPTELAEIGKKRAEPIIKMQMKLFDRFYETNREWFERSRIEAKLASEFVTKLAATHSIPDAATACQQWIDRHMETLAEDSRRFITDSQEFIEAGVQLFSNGGNSARN